MPPARASFHCLHANIWSVCTTLEASYASKLHLPDIILAIVSESFRFLASFKAEDLTRTSMGTSQPDTCALRLYSFRLMISLPTNTVHTVECAASSFRYEVSAQLLTLTTLNVVAPQAICAEGPDDPVVSTPASLTLLGDNAQFHFAAVFVGMRNRITIFSTLSSFLAQYSAASSSSGVGDYIAAGLRKDASSTTIASSNSVLTSSSPSFAASRNTTTNTLFINSDHAALISSTSSSGGMSNSHHSMDVTTSTGSFAPVTSANSSIFHSSTGSTSTSANSSIHHFMNLAAPSVSAHNLTHSNSSRNASLDDSCWNSWSSHWNLLNPIKTTYVTTAVSTDIQPVTSDSSTAFWYVTVVQLTTVTQFDGAHAIATSAFTDTETYSFPSTTTIGISTVTETITTSVSAPTEGITAPPCALPSFVPHSHPAWSSPNASPERSGRFSQIKHSVLNSEMKELRRKTNQ
ncbi:uncharacterized protein MYCFIDRAFT_179109 [Pseudocercospora fijiensis CIRAD86]|uniref:Uncharacterized protein n=1 Tax=Pseudocercospora fijiensis (strain CIRAD86) TaxID=383855 RepID=M2ZZK0_PSEFD|nr:uncharacterized protein MYCFIDRAFT_179109 [Pseudocercospora fijiensis CIRAD86]EME77591.1 hypothetical protein MYCFIDRAFT_179109 [Pseudocercospora fijiensis CIRAD86]